MFGPETHSDPAMGYGYRAELNSFGVDVSFLNFQVSSSNADYGSTGFTSGSLLKLEGLYFMNPVASATAYAGGGLSWGATKGWSGNQN